MDNTKPITPHRPVDPKTVTYWSSAHSVPSGIDQLTELCCPGAWRIALTLPDLVAAGLGVDVARCCIKWAGLAWGEPTEAEDRRILDIAIGLALQIADGKLDGNTIVDGWYSSERADIDSTTERNLASELLRVVSAALRPDRDRGGFFETFADFASAIGAANPQHGRDEFDLMLLDVAAFFHASDDTERPTRFVDGEQVEWAHSKGWRGRAPVSVTAGAAS